MNHTSFTTTQRTHTLLRCDSRVFFSPSNDNRLLPWRDSRVPSFVLHSGTQLVFAPRKFQRLHFTRRARTRADAHRSRVAEDVPLDGEVSRGRAKRYFDDSIRSFIEVNRPLTGEILCGNTGMRMRYFLSGCFLCIYSVLISNGSIGNQYGFLSALPLFFFLFFVRKKLSQGIRINSTKNTMHVMS